MKRSIWNTHHVVDLTQEEELRFIAALQKRYGTIRGNVMPALHEAVMQWIWRVESE